MVVGAETPEYGLLYAFLVGGWGGVEGLWMCMALHRFVLDLRDCIKGWSHWQLKSPASTIRPWEEWIEFSIGIRSVRRAESGVICLFCESRTRFCWKNADESLFFESVAR